MWWGTSFVRHRIKRHAPNVLNRMWHVHSCAPHPSRGKTSDSGRLQSVSSQSDLNEVSLANPDRVHANLKRRRSEEGLRPPPSQTTPSGVTSENSVLLGQARASFEPRRYRWTPSAVSEGINPASTIPAKKKLLKKMQVLSQKGNWRGVLNAMRSAKSHGLKMNVIIYGCATSAMAKRGRWREVLSLVDDMKGEGIEPNDFVFGATIEACGKGGKWELALRLLDDFRAAGLHPNAIIFTSAVSACARAGQWEVALSLLSQMKKDGVEPNAYTYSAAATACKEAGQWIPAVALLSEMRDNGLEPNGHVYSAAIGACGEAGEWNRAVLLLEEMWASDLEVDAVCHNAALTALAKAGQVDLSETLFAEMLVYGTVPTEYTYAAMITAHAKTVVPNDRKDHNDVAGVITQGMEGDNIGSWIRAVELLEEMLASGYPPNLVAFTSAACACTAAGEWQHALTLVNRCEVLGLVPDLFLYGAVMMACIEGGEYEYALEIASRLKPEIRKQHENGEVSEEDRFVGDWAQILGNGWHQWVEANDRESGFEAAGDSGTTCSTVHSGDAGVFNTSQTKEHCISMAVTAAAKLDRWDLAAEYVGVMRLAGLKPPMAILGVAVEACQRAGQFSAAVVVLEHWRAMGVPRDLRCYNSVITSFPLDVEAE